MQLRFRALRAALLIGSTAAFCGSIHLACGVAKADDDVMTLVQRMLSGMGGQHRFDQLRCLTFAFEIEQSGRISTTRRWTLDRMKHRVRLDLDTDDGLVSMLFEVDGPAGVALHRGEPAPAAEQAELVDHARSLWRNDSYWLLMPWKLCDPGVHLELLPDSDFSGRHHKRIQVKFDAGTGSTPRDVYELFLDAESCELVRFAFRQQRNAADQPMAIFNWLDWQTVGGVRFSCERRMIGGADQVIRVRDLAAPTAIDGELFAAMSPP